MIQWALIADRVILYQFTEFAFEKKPFPGSEALLWVYVATMMVPPQVAGR